MRKAKLHAQKKPIKQHTRAERLALRRKKRKAGPSAQRRAERRKPLRDAALRTSVKALEAQAVRDNNALLDAAERALIEGTRNIEEPVGIRNYREGEK